MNVKLGKLMNDLTTMGSVDFHTHSTASDGSFTPEEVFDLAAENRLNCFALTDHDNNQGVLNLLENHPSLADYMENQQLTYESFYRHIKDHKLAVAPLIIPGIELNVEFEGQNVHLLAYFQGADIKKMNEFLKSQRENRAARNKKMIQKFHSLNIQMPDTLLAPTSDEPAPGRVKAAKWLVKNGYVHSIQEAFSVYVGDNKAAYVPRQKVSIKEALKIIHAANGFPVIAHAHQYGWCANKNLLKQKIKKLATVANIGVEVFHSDADLKQQNMLWQAAEQNHLYITAGSDFHGVNKEKHDLYQAFYSPSNHYGKNPTNFTKPNTPT